MQNSWFINMEIAIKLQGICIYASKANKIKNKSRHRELNLIFRSK